MSFKPNEDAFKLQRQISEVADKFEEYLKKNLNLMTVACPLFVESGTGINDDLDGNSKPVIFDLKNFEMKGSIVQSLAKWKRNYLGELYPELKADNFKSDSMNVCETEGIVTDMRAIRPNEIPDSIHSFYVDQFDWERVLTVTQRNEEYLKMIVKKIYQTFKQMEDFVYETYGIKKVLPEEITFISVQEIVDMFPNAATKEEREDLAAKKYGAFFLQKIGVQHFERSADKKTKKSCLYEIRAPDYDDWELNGDIIFHFEPLERSLEMSSMGIRVTEESMRKQLESSKNMHRAEKEYQKKILEKKLPYTIGGGIGKSRILMFLLKKEHIKDVQVSVWPRH